VGRSANQMRTIPPEMLMPVVRPRVLETHKLIGQGIRHDVHFGHGACG